MKNRCVNINAEMEDLIFLAIRQNFVPVVDQGVFIGIVRRREIIEYCGQLLESLSKNRNGVRVRGQEIN